MAIVMSWGSVDSSRRRLMRRLREFAGRRRPLRRGAHSNFSVSEAVARGISGSRHCRTGELGAQRGQYVPATGHGTRFRARNLFHGVDQHRQPSALVASRLPCPELLTHRLSLKPCLPLNPSPLPIRKPESRSRIP